MYYSLSRISKSLDQRLPREFAQLERICFSDLYSITPKSVDSFHAMFRRDCEVLTLKYNSDLIGMAFTEYAGDLVMYLRVICIHPEYRGRGLGLTLMRSVHEVLRSVNKCYLAFTSENNKIATLATKAGMKVVEHVQETAAFEEIYAYNHRLLGREPGDILEDYYERPDGSPVDAILFVMRSPNYV